MLVPAAASDNSCYCAAFHQTAVRTCTPGMRRSRGPSARRRPRPSPHAARSGRRRTQAARKPTPASHRPPRTHTALSTAPPPGACAQAAVVGRRRHGGHVLPQVGRRCDGRRVGARLWPKHGEGGWCDTEVSSPPEAGKAWAATFGSSTQPNSVPLPSGLGTGGGPQWAAVGSGHAVCKRAAIQQRDKRAAAEAQQRGRGKRQI